MPVYDARTARNKIMKLLITCSPLSRFHHFYDDPSLTIPDMGFRQRKLLRIASLYCFLSSCFHFSSSACLLVPERRFRFFCSNYFLRMHHVSRCRYPSLPFTNRCLRSADYQDGGSRVRCNAACISRRLDSFLICRSRQISCEFEE